MSSVLLVLITICLSIVADEEMIPEPLELPRAKTATSGSGTVDPDTWMAIDPEADPFQILVRNHPEKRQENQFAVLNLIWPLEYQKKKPRSEKIIRELEKSIRDALNPKELGEMMREPRTREEQENEQVALFAIMFPQVARANQHWIP